MGEPGGPLGYIADNTGQNNRALDYYQRALALYRIVGHTYYQANILDRLGHTHTALGQITEARTAWQQALDLYQTQQRDTDASRVAQHLSAVPR